MNRQPQSVPQEMLINTKVGDFTVEKSGPGHSKQETTPHARDKSRASSSTGRKEEREGSWPRVNRKPVLRLRGPSVAPVQRPGTVLASLAGLFSVEPH